MKKTFLSVVLSFLAGILFAPRSGKETRQLIKDEIDDYRKKK